MLTLLMSLFISMRRPEAAPNEDDLLFPEAAHLPAVKEGPDLPESWLPANEGQLAVDVYDAEKEIVVRAAIAAARHEDIEVFLHDDLLTIRGHRDAQEPEGRPLLRECHWGSFSRTLVLPSEIDAEGITALIRDGVLTVHLPKVHRSRRIAVKS